MSIVRLEIALAFCGILTAIVGVLLSVMSLLHHEPGNPEQDWETAKLVSRHLLFFAALCLGTQYFLHC